MLVTLDAQDARPIYVQIMDEVRRALLVGTLRPEDALPSVRELASELVINPRTVRQAYGELEREGIVYVKRGQGTFVSPHVQVDSLESRELGRAVAKRVLVEARRNGLGVDELVRLIREVEAEEASEHSESPGPANVGVEA